MPLSTRQDPTVSKDANSSDRRRSERKKVLRGAKIIYNGGHCTLDCSIVDLSETGACLVLPTLVPLPENITLMLDDERKRPAEIVWSASNRLGVRFLDIAVPAARENSDTELLNHVRSIELKIDELRDILLSHLKNSSMHRGNET